MSLTAPDSNRRFIISIAGPTACGKSSLALSLAEYLKAIIINADAMQVYRDLAILTARPAVGLQKSSSNEFPPHFLYGHVGASENYSVARWLDEIARIITKYHIKNRHIIIVGGSGLYFQCLFNGLSSMPTISSATKNHLFELEASFGKEGLFEILQKCDPVSAATIKPHDYRRISRSLAVFLQSGKPIAKWQQENINPPIVQADKAIRLFLNPPREELYRRIDTRFLQMIKDGALEEARYLKKLDIPPEATVLQALGLKPLFALIDNKLPLDDAVKIAQRNTRRYAKRQWSWARKYMKEWQWLEENQYQNHRHVIDYIKTLGVFPH